MKKLITALVAGFFATSAFCSNVIESVTDHNVIQNQICQQQSNGLILQKNSDMNSKFAGHYSHSSHASHASHVSHYSSRY